MAIRITKEDYEKFARIAMRNGKTISGYGKEIIHLVVDYELSNGEEKE